MKVALIGVGLMGGSMAIDLKKNGFCDHIAGVDQNNSNLEEALNLGFIDEKSDLKSAVQSSNLVLVAIPVDAIRGILNQVLNRIDKNTIVVDFGSSKAGICQIAKDHPRRQNFVACHPIAGTEFSGPTAAHSGLYIGKMNIICNREQSSEEAVKLAKELFESVGMNTIFMNAEEHDRHIAYVSHLSHVISFTLGLTVLDIEKNEKNIFNMAGSGFESTARLAKSSPEMWSPIFEQNSKYLTQALDAYIDKLKLFRKAVKEKDRHLTHRLISEGNEIRRILDGIELKNKEK